MTRWPNHQTFPAVSSAYHRTASVWEDRPAGPAPFPHRTAVVATPSTTRGASTTVAVERVDPVFA